MAVSGDKNLVHEYHQLIGTGLKCLETAAKMNKLSPRVEALIKIRYGCVLCEETENITEAEAALQSAATVCETASLRLPGKHGSRG